MKQFIAVLHFVIWTVTCSAQSLSNLPSNLGVFTAFQNNPLAISLSLPSDYQIPSPVTSEIWTDGKAASEQFAPVVDIADHSITIRLTADQVKKLPKSSQFYVKFDGIYKLGGEINPVLKTGKPSTSPTSVTLADLGTIKMSFSSDTRNNGAAAAKMASTPQTDKNQWSGKKIVWCGTSIPWQFADNSYPKQIGRILGAEVHNTAISGSMITFYPPKGGKIGQQGMSGTLKELSSAGYSQNYSYENRIIPYLKDPYNVDLVVIDHGHNDTWIADTLLGDIDSRDKGTIYGAFNTVISEILKVKPTVTIILCTPPSLYINGGVPKKIKQFKTVRKAILEIAEKWGLPVLDWSMLCGLNAQAMSERNLTHDGVHPNQLMVNKMSVIGSKFIMGLD